MAGIAIYVGVYTHWLKRSSPQNISDWRSRRSGPLPWWVGLAVTGRLKSGCLAIFLYCSLSWTPPPFFGDSAMLIQDDYCQSQRAD